ncbi:helix-turn-helix domain-containing protein, partial [Streptomyces sp. gb1(2016)]
MTQEGSDLDGLVRMRIRALRAAHSWSLDDLAARCHLSPSTLSRIETGHRRIALDQLTVIARALGTSLDQLVETDADLVWASASLHHVDDPAAALTGVRAALRPGGLLAVAELDGLPRFLPDDAVAGRPGLEARCR